MRLDDPEALGTLEELSADEPVRQLVRVESEEDLNLLRQIAEEDGLEVEEPLETEIAGIDDALLILGIVGAASVVAGAINYGREKRKGGQVIDLTKMNDEKRYRRVKGLQYGLVVVIAADGNGVTVDVKEPRGFFSQVVADVINALAGVIKEPANKVIETVKKAVGSRGNVKPEIPAAAHL